MTIRLKHVTDSPSGAASLYRYTDGKEFWIPRTVIKSRLKFPKKHPLDYTVHELSIEDWWWEKHEKEQYDNDNDE